MIKIDLLKNHPEFISKFAYMLSKALPVVLENQFKEELIESLNDNKLPIGFIALDNDLSVGSCCLFENDGIRFDLKPWIANLIVDLKYQRRGIGKMLIDATLNKAKEMNFDECHLFTFDSVVSEYYSRLGWEKIGVDEFKGHSVIVMRIGL